MLDADILGLEQQLLGIKRDLPDALLDLAASQRENAESYARQLMEVQIYSQPQVGSYERSRQLIGSVEGFVVKNPSGFDVVLEARGGANNRDYAAFVEAGTLESRVDLDTIVRDARASDGLEPLNYGRGNKGARARPSVIPALAQVERELEVEVLKVVNRVAG